MPAMPDIFYDSPCYSLQRVSLSEPEAHSFGYECLCFPVLGLQAHLLIPGFLTQELGIQTQVFTLVQQCSYFTDENKFKERLRKSYMPPHNIQQKIQ